MAQKKVRTRISPKTGNKQELINGRWHNVDTKTSGKRKRTLNKNKVQQAQSALDEIKEEAKSQQEKSVIFTDDDIHDASRVANSAMEKVENIINNSRYDDDMQNNSVKVTEGVKRRLYPNATAESHPYHVYDEEYIEDPEVIITKPYKFHAEVFPDLTAEQIVSLEMEDYLLDGEDFFAGIHGGYYGDEFDGMHLTTSGKEKIAAIQAWLIYDKNFSHNDEEENEEYRDYFIDKVSSSSHTVEKNSSYGGVYKRSWY